jgi:hypothetical protein
MIFNCCLEPLQLCCFNINLSHTETLAADISEGDFPPYEDWSAEDFRVSIVNVPLLKAIGDDIDDLDEFDKPLMMRDGCITVNLLWFSDDSSWVPCRKFSIGAWVVPIPRTSYDGEAFVVRDLNRKHYPPAPDDPVWRLEMIDKDGEVHKKLMSNHIRTVQDLFRFAFVKQIEFVEVSSSTSHCALIRAVPFYSCSAFCLRGRFFPTAWQAK